MTREWYYRSGDSTHGPVSGAELNRLTRTGEVQPDDLVRKDGGSNWVPAARVRGLFTPAAAADPPPAPVPAPTDGSGSVPTAPAEPFGFGDDEVRPGRSGLRS